MSRIKNKNLLKLNKLIEPQKKKFGWTPNLFSYKFDYRSKRLIINYTLPTQSYEKGKIKVLMKHAKPYYIKEITEDNFQKFFKSDISVFEEHIQWVKEWKEEAHQKTYGKGDKTSFTNWVENFYHKNPNLSPATIKSYKQDCDRYMTWVTAKYDDAHLLMVHKDYAYDWVTEWLDFMMKKKKWSADTTKRAYRNLKSMYNYFAQKKRGEFPYDILRGIKLPTSNSKRDKLNSREFDKVVKFIQDKKDDLYWSKFILMLHLQIKTGMRIGELRNIRNSDIEVDNKRIWITGKGNKERKQNFTSKSDKNLWKDILKQMKSGEENGYLFYRSKIVSMGGDAVEINKQYDLPTDSFYSNRFREMRDDVLKLRGKGIITSHSLRRYFITDFVNRTGRRDLARQIVGHTSTRMTDYYMGDLIEEDTETTIDIGI